MLGLGDEIEVIVEKPAAGGRMLARLEGRIILVHGAIPGERIRARVTKVERQLAFASTSEVLDGSPDRRPTFTDLACGGCSYAHINYPRQLQLKAEVIKDAFARQGHIHLEAPLDVKESPERGYRMRARFHVRDGRIGFYREGSHELCDPRTTGQLLDETVAAVSAAVNAVLASAPVAGAEVTENLSAVQRVLYLESSGGAEIPLTALETAVQAGGLTGCSAHSGTRSNVAGVPVVTDALEALTKGRAGAGQLERHAESFFQANRFLLPDLVTSVLSSVLPDGSITELYAGVGLFSISLAHTGRERITAVEGDRASARDLMANASTCGASVRVVVGSVEEYLSSNRARTGTMIVDPPRTGISRRAIEAILRSRPERVVYVSCDPPTMARDAARLLSSGYGLTVLQAFDLFPNTPHVEALGVFDRTGAGGSDKPVE